MKVDVETLFGRMDYIEKEFALRKKALVREYIEVTGSFKDCELTDEVYEAIYSLMTVKRLAYKKGEKLKFSLDK